MRPSDERRGRVLVNREVQVHLLVRIAVNFLASVPLFLAISLGFPLVVGLAGSAPDWAMSQFMHRLRLLLSFAALPLACAIFVLFAAGVRETFRFAGPLYRVEKVFKDLKQLRIHPGLRIREDDLLQKVVSNLNEGLLRLHDQVREVVARNESSLAEHEKLIQSHPELASELRPLRAELDALRAACANFVLLNDNEDDASPVLAAESAVEPVPDSATVA